MSEKRERVTRALRRFRYESSRGGKRGLMEHHIKALSDFLCSPDFLALVSQQESDDSVTVCTCNWAHPVDGSIDPSGPAEIEPDCPAHGWRDPEPEPTR